MKIKKVFQGSVPENKILGTYTESDTDTYSCNYLNKSAMTRGLHGRQDVNYTTAWATYTIPFNNSGAIVVSKGSNLEVYNNGIKIKKNMTALITMQVAIWQSSFTTSEFDFKVMKNDTELIKAYYHVNTVGELLHANAAPCLCELQAGDVIYGAVSGGFTGTFKILGDDRATYLTVIEM